MRDEHQHHPRAVRRAPREAVAPLIYSLALLPGGLADAYAVAAQHDERFAVDAELDAIAASDSPTEPIPGLQ